MSCLEFSNGCGDEAVMEAQFGMGVDIEVSRVVGIEDIA